MKEILKQALAEIKPSKEEEIRMSAQIGAIVSKIQKAVPKCKVILGGSGEKGTWLKDAHDADIFVQFPKGTKEDISKYLHQRIKKLFKLRTLHGSRDYFQTTINKFTYEIVPIIEIEKAEDAQNITDASPLHSKWVKKHKEYVDEIRLTKQFFKAARVYGAESYINGFSGYICEILTIYYQGFAKTVKAIASWKPQVIIDSEGQYRGKNILFELNDAKRKGPLIVIDPIQASRNAAAAVSLEKFDEIVEYCKEFLRKPSIHAFSEQTIDLEKVRAERGISFIIRCAPLKGKEDIVGCKLLKAFMHIKKGIEAAEFSILLAEWEWKTDAFFYFVLKKETLSEKKIIKGPPLARLDFAKDFKKKHKETYEDNGNIYALEKREYRTPSQFMKQIIADPYVKERIASAALEEKS